MRKFLMNRCELTSTVSHIVPVTQRLVNISTFKLKQSKKRSIGDSRKGYPQPSLHLFDPPQAESLKRGWGETRGRPHSVVLLRKRLYYIHIEIYPFWQDLQCSFEVHE